MQTAKDVFLDFIDQMRNWENEMAQAMKKHGELYICDHAFSEKMRQQLIDIQEKCLSQKALSLTQDRRLALNFQVPPEYDQIIVAENAINSKKVEIVSHQNGDDNVVYQYTLVLENQLWKVDKVAYGWMKSESFRKLF